MSGTLRGKIECYHYQGSGGSVNYIMNEVFKNLYDFFSNWPSHTVIIASNYDGGGTDYWDGASPFGGKSWFVVKFLPSSTRTYPWYLMVQLSYMATNVNTGHSAPCVFYGEDVNYSNARIAFTAAVGVGGDENPWAGTMGAGGSDTKGNPVWKIPGSGGTAVYALDRSNATGGTYAADKRNMTGYSIYNPLPSTRRVHILADDDCFAFTFDNLAASFWTYFVGPYTLRSGLSLDHPMMMIALGSPYYGQYSQHYGSTSGGSTRPGGIVPVVGGSPRDVKMFYLEWLDTMNSEVDLHPNPQFATPAYDLSPFVLGIRDAPYFGFVGFLDWLRLAWNVPYYDTSSDKKLVFLGSATQADRKLVMPWDGVTIPGSGLTRGGVTVPAA